MPESNALIGFISIAMAFMALLPYYWGIYKKTVKPHAFSWFIWGLLGIIGYCAQDSGGAGSGAFTTLFFSILCLIIAFISWGWGERNITRSDWISFIAAISALPLWYWLHNPLAAIVIVSMIDMLGYYPTFRKSWQKPDDELIFSHLMGGGGYALSIMAMAEKNLTTILYPASITFSACSLSLMLFYRRYAIKKKSSL
ncbi:MAG: hypothetical protein ACOYK8_02975 [Alphaproteobacteria bacterium]